MSKEFDYEVAKKDIEFLLSFSPGIDEVPAGLMAMFYVTGTYQGDVDLVNRLREITKRWNISEDEVTELIDEK